MNRFQHYIIIGAFLLASGQAHLSAQKRVGDFIESTSYNDDKHGVTRTIQYQPEGNAFVCINGSNRYTRALYGGHTDYRLETSDRPVFALFQDSKNCRNVSFHIRYKGKDTALDSTTYCKAWYMDGMRRYTVRNEAWGSGELSIEAHCLTGREASLWKFVPNGFADSLHITVRVSGIAIKKLQRNGDMGADPPGCFESDGVLLQELSASTVLQPICFLAEGLVMEIPEEIPPVSPFHSPITFSTPDPYINPLGAALAYAADGAWDGQTWLHGAIGWRTELAGWRAGYLGDVLGWPQRAVSHFDAYAKSMVTEVPPTIPHPSQDPKQNLARAEKRWGTQMYSNGYLCRKPGKNDQMNHYDMNLNYVDELLWHFQYDADTAYMRRMFPLLQAHLAWEKRNYDPDDDGLYDAYCCIWASDALYYSGGAVTHSSAYNYRSNLLTAKIARLLGEDAAPYEQEARKILNAMNRTLWLEDKGHWAEYKDLMGLQRIHENAAVWSIYTPIDCGAATPQQAFRAVQYVDRCIPHIPVAASPSSTNDCPSTLLPPLSSLHTISTSNWMPYSWSINNVASAEVMHTALAFFEAGESEKGFQLMKANIIDQMYLGASPGNFGQVSYLDAARGECYRDFSDNTGISARTLIQGLFGIIPQALDGQCIIRPGFPAEWNEASIETPYLSYRFHRENGKDIYEIHQHFPQPLQIILRQNLGNGEYRDYVAGEDSVVKVEVRDERREERGGWRENTFAYIHRTYLPPPSTLLPPLTNRFSPLPLNTFNASVSDIFRNEYLSPRPPVTTLQIPKQGVGEWCHPLYCPEINDSVFRSLAIGDRFTVAGIPFRTPQEGPNIAYTSLWDNYPDSITIPVKGRADGAYLLMAGSTNHMQFDIDNALVIATYRDGSQDTLHLIPPYNWCPIEQDYFVDNLQFTIPQHLRPWRICLGNGIVSRNLGEALGIQGVYGREISGGAAQMLWMPLNNKKKLKSLTLRTLSNDVVVGLMAVTLAKAGKGKVQNQN